MEARHGRGGCNFPGLLPRDCPVQGSPVTGHRFSGLEGVGKAICGRKGTVSLAFQAMERLEVEEGMQIPQVCRP